MYDDKILIFYNTDDNHPTIIKIKDTEELISHLNDIALLETSIKLCRNKHTPNRHCRKTLASLKVKTNIVYSPAYPLIFAVKNGIIIVINRSLWRLKNGF